MTESNASRPPYRLAFCPRAEAERVAQSPEAARDVFSPAELEGLDPLIFKRRLDRVSGRLAAKRALCEHFEAEHGWKARLDELEIFNDEAGRPTLRLPAGAPSTPSFSIAHCAEGGAAAVGAGGRRVGIDCETVIQRPSQIFDFVRAPGDDAANDPEAQTRLWTGKEAALKLLGLGLNADARAVLLGRAEAAFEDRPAQAWRELGSPRVGLAYQRTDAALIAVAFTGD